MFTYRVDSEDSKTVYVIADDHDDFGSVTNKDHARELVQLLNNGAELEEVVNYGIQMAKEYALLHHGEQEHGCLTIAKHLEMVAWLVEQHHPYTADSYERLSIVSAAWCHDILEDTGVTVPMLGEELSEDAMKIVTAVTDYPGENRYERHLNTYWRIREAGPDAVLVKLCDRVHNHARSLEHKERYCKMYLDEYPYFKMALWRPGEHVKLWGVLDNQYKAMQDAEKLQERERVAEHTGTGGSPHGTKPGAGESDS
jgi:hypothetical protein